MQKQPLGESEYGMTTQRNTWIFQGTPDRFKIREYINAAILKSPPYIVWTVTSHENDLDVGDDVFIWQAMGKQPQSSGILALCEIASEVAIRKDDDTPISYWEPGEKPSEDRKRVVLRVKSVAEPDKIIRRDFLQQDTTCKDMHILKNPRGTNFSTENSEQERLHELWDKATNPLETDYYKSIERQAQDNEKLSLEQIEKRYEANQKSNEASSTTTTVRVYRRNQDVVAIRKMKANFQCEVPGCSNIPFQKASNKWYCEVHHIKPLSEGGSDSPENTACLCPAHHREIHYGKNAGQLKKQLQQLRDNEKEPS